MTLLVWSFGLTAGHRYGCLVVGQESPWAIWASLTCLLLLCSAFLLQPLAICGWSGRISAEEGNSKYFLCPLSVYAAGLVSQQPPCLTWLTSFHRQKIKSGRCLTAHLIKWCRDKKLVSCSSMEWASQERRESSSLQKMGDIIVLEVLQVTRQ